MIGCIITYIQAEEVAVKFALYAILHSYYTMVTETGTVLWEDQCDLSKSW